MNVASTTMKTFPSSRESSERFGDRKWSLMAILVLALIVRVSAAMFWQDKAEGEGTLFRFGDSHSYWTLAEHLARGESYEYGGSEAKIFRAPGYPCFLAPFTRFSPPNRAVLFARLAGCGLGVLVVSFVMWLAFRWGGLLARDLAGLLACGYPGAIGMSVFILSEALFCPLVLISLVCATVAQQRESNQSEGGKIYWKGWIGCGMASGLACLCRPSWILFPICFLVMECCIARPWRESVARTLLIVVAACLVMSPWWIRNSMVTGRFVPTTLQVGATLYDGWHEGASGGSDEGMEFVSQFASELRRREAESSKDLSSTFEYRLDRELYAAACRWAWNNPLGVVRLSWSKFVRTWSPLPRASQIEGAWLRWAEASAYVVILGSGLVLLVFSWRAVIDVRLLWYPLAYYAILHTIFVGSVRYRQPPVLILTAVAGLAIAALWKRLGRSLPKSFP